MLPCHALRTFRITLALENVRAAVPIFVAIEEQDLASIPLSTIMQMDKGLDTGEMLLKASCVIAPDETASTLHDKLLQLGATALAKVLAQMEAGDLQPEKQDDSQANYAEKKARQIVLARYSLM